MSARTNPPKILGMEVSLQLILTLLLVGSTVVAAFSVLQYRVEAVANEIKSAKLEHERFLSQREFDVFREQLWQRLDRIEDKVNK